MGILELDGGMQAPLSGQPSSHVQENNSPVRTGLPLRRLPNKQADGTGKSVKAGANATMISSRSVFSLEIQG